MPLLGVFNDLLFGLGVALTPVNMTIVIVGLILGTAIGVLPGLGGTNGVALLLPLTFTLQPTSAIILLSSSPPGAAPGRWPPHLTDIPWRNGASRGSRSPPPSPPPSSGRWSPSSSSPSSLRRWPSWRCGSARRRILLS